MNNLTNLDEAVCFDPVDETELGLCRALWASVAMQAIIDAKSQSKKPTMQRIRESARSWIQPEGEEKSDFEMVCEFAGIDIEVAQKRFQEIVENNEDGIDFRCLKKEAPHNKGQENRARYVKRMRDQKSARTLH